MPHGLTTAPINPAPQWPSGYIEALREVGAQEKAIPFCIQWVRGFFAEHPGRRRRDLGRPEIEAFLRKVAARPNVTNWQVQQARVSLEVYYERFRGVALAPRPDAVVAPTVSAASAPVRGPSLPSAIEQMAVTAAPPDQVKPLHRFGTYDPTSPPVKPFRMTAATPSPTRDTKAVASAFRTTTGPGQRPGRPPATSRRKPSQLGAVEVTAFLKHLALRLQVASSTQNQALNAIVRGPCLRRAGTDPSHSSTRTFAGASNPWTMGPGKLPRFGHFPDFGPGEAEQRGLLWYSPA